MKAWRIVSDGGIDALSLDEVASPALGPGQVRVAMRANSVNFRDYSTILDPIPRGLAMPRIPNSDGAGEVVEVGPGVTQWSVGDRVAGCFFELWIDGPCSAGAMASARGGAVEGMLAEEVVAGEDTLVAIPEGLSYAEAACLPCAGLTAWRALAHVGRVTAGDTVLLLGTGGVSIFALQFAKAMGCRVVITSSSDDKLARAKAMGADETVNYRTTPDWDVAVNDITGGGADLVVEVGGPGTAQKSVNATRVAGAVAMIGILADGVLNPIHVMRKSIRLEGVYVGPRNAFLDMNRAIAQNGIRPVVDLAVPFAEAPRAYHAMGAQGHFGKIVIEM